MGPNLPGCDSPPGCGASSKVGVWRLACGPGFNLQADRRASLGQESRWLKEAAPRMVPRQLSSGESLLQVPDLPLQTRSPENKENP